MNILTSQVVLIYIFDANKANIIKEKMAHSSINYFKLYFYYKNVLAVTFFVTTFASLYIINTQPLIFTKDIYYDQKTFT